MSVAGVDQKEALFVPHLSDFSFSHAVEISLCSSGLGHLTYSRKRRFMIRLATLMVQFTTVPSAMLKWPAVALTPEPCPTRKRNTATCSHGSMYGPVLLTRKTYVVPNSAYTSFRNVVFLWCAAEPKVNMFAMGGLDDQYASRADDINSGLLRIMSPTK